MSGPPPKPAAQRRRRNRAPAPVKLPVEKTAEKKTPTLPGAKRYSKTTRDWWATVWGSPMATVWLEADVPALVRLATLIELLEQGEATAMVLAEIRQLEDRFGLSPMARRRLQWEVEQAAVETKPVANQEVRWLRAVSD
jgi:hypothetical protein